MQEKAPSSFNSLYQLSSLDNKFNKHYGKEEGTKKFIELFKNNQITAFYQRNNDKDPFDFKNPSENTILGYRVGYEMSKGVSLIWEYSEFYRDNGSGELEPIRQTKVETAFSF